MCIIVLHSPIHILISNFSFSELSFIKSKTNIFPIQEEIIINSLFIKLTEVSTNNFKMHFK